MHLKFLQVGLSNVWSLSFLGDSIYQKVLKTTVLDK